MLGSMNVEWMLIYTPMSPMRLRYSPPSVLRITELHFTSVSYLEANIRTYSFAQAACDTEGTSILVQVGPEHKLNLRGAPYELVLEY